MFRVRRVGLLGVRSLPLQHEGVDGIADRNQMPEVPRLETEAQNGSVVTVTCPELISKIKSDI